MASNLFGIITEKSIFLLEWHSFKYGIIFTQDYQ